MSPMNTPEHTLSESATIDHDAHEDIRRRIDQLHWQIGDKKKRLDSKKLQCDQLIEYLELAPEVSDALKTLSSELFEHDLRILEKKMSIALQEVLGQPVKFKADTGFKGNVATVDFSIERVGNMEDLKRGQGGSVHNVLSVGLRMFALTMLDEEKHQRFLMLDEQDCWLQPELVPKLVKIVHQAGKELGYQVIMISHHSLSSFENYADKIYSFEPAPNHQLSVNIVNPDANAPDSN